MKYDFDKLIERRGTDSVKYDLLKPLFGREDLLPMWVADMDFEVPVFIRKALSERLEHPVLGYTWRPERFYEALSGWLERRHGWKTDPKHMNFSPGIVPALNLCVLGYTDPGDRIVVQPPVYFPFFSAVNNHKRELVYNQLIEEEGVYRIDMEQLEEEFKKGVKMLFFCHPHNPVGRAWSKEELEALAELCVKYKVLVLSDEIHSDLLLFGKRHIPLASLGKEIADLCITCVAPSKTFNLAGLHSSAVIIEHKKLKAIYDKVLDDVHVGGGNIFGQVAMETAYREGDHWLEELLAYLEGNYLFMQDFFQSRLPQLRLYPLEATYLVWSGFQSLGMNDEQLKEFIVNEARLGLVDGPRFGPGGEGYQRFNIAAPRSVVEKALIQLQEAMESMYTKNR